MTDPLTASDGPPALLMLPGMLGTAAVWDAVAARLRERVSPVPTLLAGRIDGDSSVEALADAVLAAAPERFALAGHSLGGVVALAVLRRAPERVSHLAALNASALAPNPDQLSVWAAWETQARDGDFRALARHAAHVNLGGLYPEDGELFTIAEQMALACGPPVLLRQLAAQRGRPDARAQLGQIRCPTLVIGSEHDAVCPPQRAEEMAAAIPGARLERLAGVGHMSPLEAPDRVAELLADWWTSAAGR